MIDLYRRALIRLENYKIDVPEILHRGAPILHFGNLEKAKIATLGINPSDKEFIDKNKVELTGLNRRFHTLTSLGLDSWLNTDKSNIEAMILSCNRYFEHNPYNVWFKRLDFIISGTSKSYYFPSSEVCHLDLVPFASEVKWGEVNHKTRIKLILENMDILAELICNSKIRYLILNGAAVVNAFQDAFRVELSKQYFAPIDLIRNNGDAVKGFCYDGSIKSINRINLERQVKILGYNHNIQSSFGISSNVTKALRDWITSKVKI